MQVLYNDGVHLPATNLWLDPHQERTRAIVSHAHADHMKKHGEVIATPATAAMMQLRGARRTQFHHVNWKEQVFCDGGGSFSLWPAGHVLGSSQVLVEHNGMKLLYSGDFKLRPSLSAEIAEVPSADIVIMETTFGRPHYRFPDNETVLDDIARWCRSVLNTGSRPVVFCYSLGKGQEVLAGLRDFEAPIYLHEAHWKMANLYRQLGVEFPDYQLYEEAKVDDFEGVLLCASGCQRGRWFAELRRTHSLKTAYVSGWAMDAGAKRRFGTDCAFPLSDHAGYDDLMAYVGLSGAGTIYTTHGFDAEFARDLRAQGYLAQPLKYATGEY